MTTFKNVADNAVSTTATVLTSTGVTSIVLASGDGAKMPAVPFWTTLWTGVAGSDPGADANMEKVVCTARSTDTLTIGATTKTHAATVNVGALDVAQNTVDIQAAIIAIENAPYMDLSSVQTASNKIFTRPVLQAATPAAGVASGMIWYNIAFASIGVSDGTNTHVLDTLDGANTLTNKTLTGGLVTADPSAALGIASKQYVDGLSSATGLIQNEVPGGSVNGSNTAFTTASSFATNSLRVYRNGIRLKGGGVDFTQGSNNAFTMVTAPYTGDLLLVDYNVSATGYSVGTNSNITNEAPTGTVNGTTTVFTTARAYIAGSLQVYIDGIMQRRGTDYTETTPSSGSFTMAVAPATGQNLLTDYQFNLNPSSNADTVDGIHASTTGGQAAQLVADDGGGWLLMAPTLTYASATTITTSTDMSGYLSVGDKLRIFQTTIKYFYIVGITSTTLTVTGGSDYTVANAAITNPYYSKMATPFGFPQWFNYTPTLVGFSTNPTMIYRFTINGRQATVAQRASVAGTSNAVNYTQTLPIPSASITNQQWNGSMGDGADNGVACTAIAGVVTGTTTLVFTKGNVNSGGGNWTSSGIKYMNGIFTYEI